MWRRVNLSIWGFFSNTTSCLLIVIKFKKKTKPLHTLTHEFFHIIILYLTVSIHFSICRCCSRFLDERRKQNCYTKYSVLSLRCSNNETRVIVLYTQISLRCFLVVLHSLPLFLISLTLCVCVCVCVQIVLSTTIFHSIQ